MPATLTPLRYPGGKTKYADMFSEVIGTNHLENCTFVEVFAGGAGSAISLLLKRRVKALFLNDLDVAIYAFWKSVRDQSTEITRLIQETPVNLSEWRKQKAIYEKKDSSDTLALGFSTFYLNRCNHSGILGARPIGGMLQSTDYKIDARYNKSTSIAKIKAIAKYADAIEVSNMEGVEFLKYLKRRHRKRKCLIYLDPPYYQKGPALYLNHFVHEDHEQLRDSILQCPFPWLLSYDNHDRILELYRGKGCRLYRNSIRHTIVGNSQADELIISKAKLPAYLGRVH